MHSTSTTHGASRTYIALIPAVLLLLPASAHADTPPCSVSDTSFACRLAALLNWLEATAVVLALILVAVIGVAIHLFRKNKANRRNQK